MKLSTEEKEAMKHLVDTLMPRLERSDFEAINKYFIKLRDSKHSFSIHYIKQKKHDALYMPMPELLIW
jgi:hypothetical protein